MDKKYILDTEENKAFLQEMCGELLRFGSRFPSPGGTAWYLGDDGTPWKEKNRDCYETSRMAHCYSIGAMMGVPGAADLADQALQGLCGEMRDQANGGWYAGVAPDGKPLPDKQCYAHAFVILAASSGVLAGRPEAQELLAAALTDYDRFFWNEEQGLSCDTWNTEFTVCDPYRGLNANMHTVEAFLAAADTLKSLQGKQVSEALSPWVGKADEYRNRCGRIIRRVAGWAENNSWRIPEHYTEDWKPDLEMNKDRPDDQFKPYGATPGHGLEWARLITQWALSGASDEEKQKYLQAACCLFERAVQDAWDADGAPGIAYTTDWNGTPVVHDRMHWTLAEAIDTAAVLYRVTGKKEYADRYAEFMQYLDEKVRDHVNGSWFHQLDRNNEPLDTVWPGKPDVYHALQATLIPYSVPEKSIALAIREKTTAQA